MLSMFKHILHFKLDLCHVENLNTMKLVQETTGSFKVQMFAHNERIKNSKTICTLLFLPD